MAVSFKRFHVKFFSKSKYTLVNRLRAIAYLGYGYGIVANLRRWDDYHSITAYRTGTIALMNLSYELTQLYLSELGV